MSAKMPLSSALFLPQSHTAAGPAWPRPHGAGSAGSGSMDVPGLNGAKANSPEPRHAAPELQGCCGDSKGTATAGTAQCQGWGRCWWCWGLVKRAAPRLQGWVRPFRGVHPPCIPAAVQLLFPPRCVRYGTYTNNLSKSPHCQPCRYLSAPSLITLSKGRCGVIPGLPHPMRPGSALHWGISPAPEVRVPGRPRSNSTNPPPSLGFKVPQPSRCLQREL